MSGLLTVLIDLGIWSCVETLHWCSLNLCCSSRPDSPIYIFEQSKQFILYTILLYFSFGLLSFNLHNYFLKVFFDLLANFNEKGFNNLLTFSDAPLMYTA